MRFALLISKISIALWLALFNPLLADDIDVYGLGGTGPGAQLPNVLFVFDTSSSMETKINGEEKTRFGDPKKINILRSAVYDMLEFSRGRINVGVTSYNDTSQGIKWPVSNLLQDAHDFDVNIPVGFTVKDTVNSILQNDPSGGKTATVDALYEATRYFRGDPVWISGTSVAKDHRPHTWDVKKQKYDKGSDVAAHPASYSPRDALDIDAVVKKGKIQGCYDYTIGGTVVGESNYCESKKLESCDIPEPETLRWDPSYCDRDNSTYKWSCKLWDTTASECLRGEGSCSVPGGFIGHKAYKKCYFKGKDSLDDRWKGANYQTPIGQSCAGNYIVLLSDGAPSRNSARDQIESLIDDDCAPLSKSIFDRDDGEYYYGDCGPELANFVHSTDQLSNVANSNLTVYTIGFGLGAEGGESAQNYLREIAAQGGGEFVLANQSGSLKQAFSDIVDKVSGGKEGGSGLSVDVDRQSASHSDRAYINVFQPSGRRSWSGNTKGYYLSDSGLLDIDGQHATELSARGTSFTEEARSFWSGSTDGNSVSSGGASEQMVAGYRKLLTYTSTSTPINENLGSDDNRLVSSNTALTSGLIDSALNDLERTQLLDWLQTAPMADPLHTEPQVLSYSNRQVLFTMTNQGLLHAIDASAPKTVGDNSGGNELFAFMPQSLLSNLPALKQNAYTGSHLYGLDGALTIWHSDANNDGVVNNAERAVLFFGMRRGGKQYFALDVSNVDSPRLLWRLNSTTAGFEALGQTWSRPSLITVNWSGSERKVLVFGGGYDLAADSQSTRNAHASGHMIYMVDPLTGQLLWSAGKTSQHDLVEAMEYAIPSDLRVVDADGNGIADRLYVADLGGQVWRVKFDEATFGPNSGTTINRLATLADDTEAGNRRFFYAPTVYFTDGGGGSNHFGITLGSGNRASPLSDSTENRVYTLRDTDIPNNTGTSALMISSEDELYDATDNAVELGENKNIERNKLAQSKGWYLRLGRGEKSLSALVAFQGNLYFTTYKPDYNFTSATSCDVAGAKKRVYFVNQTDASPAKLGQKTDAAVPTSRYVESAEGGIPGEPVIVFPPTGNTVDIFVGKEKVRQVKLSLNVMYWHPSQ